MNTLESIRKDYTERFCKRVEKLTRYEINFFEYVNDDFKNEVNKFKYIDSKFIDLTSYTNIRKNIFIVEFTLVLTYQFEDKIIIQSYIMTLFSKNSNTFHYQKLSDNIELDECDVNIQNLQKISDIDIITKKNVIYYNFNLEKYINFDNIRIIKTMIKNTLVQ